jgi:teichuronic acid exporter
MKLKRHVIADAAAISTSNLVIAGTQILEIIILARLLLPEEIGIIAIIGLIFGFVRSFADCGISNALIHFQNTSRSVFSSLYWLLIVTGAAIFGLFLAVRPVIAWSMPDSPLVNLFGWIGLNFFLFPIGILYQFHFQKEMRFRRIATVESVARCTGTLTLALLAFNHAGIFSYVAGQIAYNGVKSFTLLWAGMRVLPLSFTFDLAAIRSHLRFGVFQMGERVVTFLSENVDYLIIGKFLGTRELGFYKIAYELVTVPQRLINPVFSTIALPRFARDQNNDAALRDGVLSVLRVLSLVTFPLLFGLAASAQVFVPVVYGPGWERTVPLVWLLVGMGLFKTLGNIGGSVILAKGHVKTGFIWNCIITAVNVAAFLSVVRWGVSAVAATYSALSLVYLLLSFRSYYVATIGLSPGRYIRSFVLPGVLSAIMGALVYGLYCCLDRACFNQLPELMIMVATGAVMYVLSAIVFMKKQFSGLLRGNESRPQP